MTAAQASIIYAEEADVLNVAMFGQTAKQWREAHPELKGNIRDYASINVLICLANMENINAVLIDEGVPQGERLVRLNQIALELIFEREFLLSFFSDVHFLVNIAYLSPRRTSPYLMLDEQLYNRIVGLYDSLLLELHNTGRRDPHLLRAMLYEVLMLLQKATPVETDTLSETDRVARFRQLVDEYYLTESGVDFYADKLCVTPGHLRRLVRQSLGQSTKQYIQKRRIQEAKRLLQII